MRNPKAVPLSAWSTVRHCRYPFGLRFRHIFSAGVFLTLMLGGI